MLFVVDPEATDRRSRQAFERLAGLRELLPSHQLLQINFNITVAVALVLHSVPGIELFRSQIKETCVTFDILHLDLLEENTWALRHAHSLYLRETCPLHISASVTAELSAFRDSFFRDAAVYAKACEIDAAPVNQLSYVNEHRQLASDVIALATVIKDNLAVFKNCERTSAELDRALSLAELLLRANAELELAPAAIAAANDRARAFTLFFQAYEEVRSAVQYVRRNHDDGDYLAPSLFVPLYSQEAHHRTLARLMPFEDDLEMAEQARRVAAVMGGGAEPWDEEGGEMQ